MTSLINIKHMFAKNFFMKWAPSTDKFTIWCSKRGEEVFTVELSSSELDGLEAQIKLMKQCREKMQKESENGNG